MPMFLQAGSYALLKVRETKDGDLFSILHIDPSKSGQGAYMWTSIDNLTEQQAEVELRAFTEATKIPGLFKAARDHFEAHRQTTIN